MPFYLSITEEKIEIFRPSLKRLAQSEMQPTSSWIWTLIAMSISYEEISYTKNTFPDSQFDFFTPFEIEVTILSCAVPCDVTGFTGSLISNSE